MGQYWLPVNLDKKECISPHKLGSGLKLWEQIANYPAVGEALIILTAAMPEPRGGGDFDMTSNWHGSERTFPKHNISPGPMPTDYPSLARQTIGRWAGDRIALIGDYAEPGDLPEDDASVIFGKCSDAIYHPDNEDNEYTDVSDLVCAVIEHELNGKYEGTGWRHFKYDSEREMEGENG